MHRPSRALLALAIALTACGEAEPDLREWRPEDHQQPASRQPAGDGRAAPVEDQSPEQTEIRAATALFSSMCASCHGEAGRGDGPGRPPVAEVADLTTAQWQDARSDAQIAEVIRDGRGGFMPGFGDRLSAAGVAALVRHVRRLGGRGATEGASEDGDAEAEGAPASEGGAATDPASTDPAPGTEAAAAAEAAPATEAAAEAAPPTEAPREAAPAPEAPRETAPEAP